MSGIIQNIKERTEKNENFVNKILDKKTNPDEQQKRADDLLEKLELEGMTVGKKEMSYTVGTDGKILLGK